MIAHLHLQTGLRGNVTYLKRVYNTPPFKIANVTEDEKDKWLRLMIMSSSPGVLDGDEYHIHVDVEKKTFLKLSTQSYQRLFNMKAGARQTMEVHVDEGACFSFLPHPCVPHAASIFTARNKIFLSRDCTLAWGEVFTCGRKLSGEIFHFAKYHAVTEIFLNNVLIVKENLLVQPSVIDPMMLGQLEGYTHQGTLIYLNETAPIKTFIHQITKFLSAQVDITFGITAAQKNGLILRLLGFKAEQLFNCIKTIADDVLFIVV